MKHVSLQQALATLFGMLMDFMALQEGVWYAVEGWF